MKMSNSWKGTASTEFLDKYGVFLVHIFPHIRSEYGEMRTLKNFVFGFIHTVVFLTFLCYCKMDLI